MKNATQWNSGIACIAGVDGERDRGSEEELGIIVAPLSPTRLRLLRGLGKLVT